jgi:hypothetical protein
MSNRYGITLDPAWAEWAAKASETVAAALFLICETRPLHKLTGEFERVVDIVHRSPDHFPLGTLAALESRGAMLAHQPAGRWRPDSSGAPTAPIGTSSAIARERQAPCTKSCASPETVGVKAAATTSQRASPRSRTPCLPVVLPDRP